MLYKNKFNINFYTALIVSLFYAFYLSYLSNDFFRDRENYILYAMFFDDLGRDSSLLFYLFNEPLFLYYNKVLSFVFNPEAVPKFGVFFIAFTLSYLILKHSKNILLSIIGLSLLFFVPYTFHLQLVVLRQGIATALLIWFVYLFWGRKIFYLLSFVLSFFHVSFFIVFFILFYDYILAKYIKNIQIRLFLITITTFLGSFFLLKVASNLGVRQAQSSHLEVNENGGGGFIIFSFILMFLFFRGFNNVYSNKYGRVAALGLITYLAFYFTLPVSGRIIATFLPFFYIYVVSYKNLKVTFAAVVFLIINIYLYYNSIVGGSLTLEGIRYLDNIFVF